MGVPGGIQQLSVPLTDLERLAAEGELYAILDACGSPPIQAKVRSLSPETVLCLYRGTQNEDLLKTAPYVVKVDRELLSWMVSTVWTERWGIFLAAASDLLTLHRHLRRFLVVKDPDDEVVYFRYYDPQVLPTFLSVCNEEELEEFFGQILIFATGGRSPAEVIFFHMKSLQLT